MAEIWPSLRKKLPTGGDGKRKNSKPSKAGSGTAIKRIWKSPKPANPYATIGLEKFASLLEELQSKQAAGTLVERTASTLSAARTISRSAQEWTASTLVRTATRAHSSLPSAGAAVQSPHPPAGEVPQQVVENPREESPPSPGSPCSDSQIESTSGNPSQNLTPVGVRLPTSPRCCRAMKKSTRGAFVMLMALGSFFSSRTDKVGKPLASILSFSAVIRIWRKGKVSARFIFSSAALYLLNPLQSYVVTHIPRQLSFSPRNQSLEPPQNADSDLAQPTQQDSGSLGLPSAPPASPIPLPVLEIPSPPEPTFPKKSTASSTRRLAKRISSRLKKLKVFKSSSSSSVALLTMSSSSASPPSTPSIPKPSPDSSSHHRKCPFSRHALKKEVDIPEESTSDPTVLEQHGCGMTRRMRRQRSSETMSCTTTSRLGRMLSSETLEQYNLGDSAISCPGGSQRSWAAHHADRHHEAPVVAWPMVGLFVTLLFLVAGRVPAIMATALFFVAVSPHSRARERENRALEAARKLRQRSPPLRWSSSSKFSRGSH